MRWWGCEGRGERKDSNNNQMQVKFEISEAEDDAARVCIWLSFGLCANGAERTVRVITCFAGVAWLDLQYVLLGTLTASKPCQVWVQSTVSKYSHCLIRWK